VTKHCLQKVMLTWILVKQLSYSSVFGGIVDHEKMSFRVKSSTVRTGCVPIKLVQHEVIAAVD